MNPKLSYLTLTVTSLEASLAFYRDGLGLGPWDALGSGVATKSDGLTIVLYPRKALQEALGLADAALDGHGVLLSRNVESKVSVERTAADLVAHGGRILRPPADLPWGDYGACVADPDGHIWEIVHSPPDS